MYPWGSSGKSSPGSRTQRCESSLSRILGVKAQNIMVVLEFWSENGDSSMDFMSGWWFGCHFLFSHILGTIIPIDFHIFQRGSNHQPVMWFYQYKQRDHHGMMGTDIWPGPFSYGEGLIKLGKQRSELSQRQKKSISHGTVDFALQHTGFAQRS